MVKSSKKEDGISLLLSVLYPLGGFLYAWRNLKSYSSYWAIFIFIVCFGFCTTGEFEAEDSFRYAQELKAFSMDPVGNWQMIIKDYFSSESTTKDIFVYALYYITSTLFGGNTRVFFALVAIVFGFFFLRSFRYITRDQAYDNSAFYIILAIMFMLSNSFYSINGVRFFTAAWMAVYATFQTLLSGNRRYLLLILCLPLVHGSYYAFWVFFVIAYLTRHFYKILPYIFFVSFFITDVALQIIPDIADYLPPFLQNMIWSYTMSDGALNRMSGEEAKSIPLYATILTSISRYYHVLLIYLLVRSQKSFKEEKSKEFLGFLLAYGALVNFSSLIPSMLRYWHLLIPFYLYLWVHNSREMFRYKAVVNWYPVVALYPTFLLLRKITWVTDPIFYISNAFHIIFRTII
jgi:hypothetical protein